MNKPTALIFRGQPVQYAGIGKYIYDNLPFARDFFDFVRAIGRQHYDYDALKLTFQSDASSEDLRNVFLAHSSIFPTNHALYEYLRRNAPDLQFVAAAGHSLGQVNAFVAAGALGFEEAVNIVLGGGKYLHDSSKDEIKGGLVAVMFNEDSNIIGILSRLNQMGVYLALNNAPNNVIIGGTNDMIKSAIDYIRGEGLVARPISKIEGPFHTVYVKESADRVKPLLTSTHFSDAVIPVYANTSAQEIIHAEQFRAESYKQMFMPVKWREIVQKMGRSGIERFIVIDPEPTNKNIAGTISIPGKEVLVIKDPHTLEGVVESLAV